MEAKRAERKIYDDSERERKKKEQEQEDKCIPLVTMLTEQKERESRYLTKKRKVRKRAKKCRRRQKIRASKIKNKIKKKEKSEKENERKKMDAYLWSPHVESSHSFIELGQGSEVALLMEPRVPLLAQY